MKNNFWKIKIGMAILFALPAFLSRVFGVALDPTLCIFISGLAVVSSTTILIWAAEAAQVDISASLAIAILAVIAVLPEYAVDLFLAYTAGHNPDYVHYAAANMTGSNRLLLGFGWPVVAFVFAFFARRKKSATTTITLEPKRRIELAFLIFASVVSVMIMIKGNISILDSAILLTLFIIYILRVSKEEVCEPELLGVANNLGSLPKNLRRFSVAALFILAATFIVSAAEPFANSLIFTGKRLGIDEFLLVQWIAPLASEAPEMIAAVVLASRLKGDAGIGILLSAKVNQWTLLVGCLPIALIVGGGGTSLALDSRQNAEFILTTAQTILGVALLMDLRFRKLDAAVLLTLFALQFLFYNPQMRIWTAIAYFVFAIVLIIIKRKSFLPVFAGLKFKKS